MYKLISINFNLENRAELKTEKKRNCENKNKCVLKEI